jgi:hypothetical protein
VPAEKKGSSKIRACVDFRNLNRATHKDEYPLPIVDMLINDASGHRVISFLDGNADYNKKNWLRKTYTKQLLGVLDLLVSLSGLS